MEATILGEDGRTAIVQVFDNSGIEHALAINPDGVIEEHGQEGYPVNPKERTNTEDEYVSQARRFACYVVYRERGHDTLEAHRNPDRIAAVLLAVSLLSSDGFEQSFGALYQQFRSHYDETVSQAVPLPAGVDPDSFILYMQDVTLEGEPEGRWRELAERLSARASETADRPSIRDLVTRTSRDAGEVFESLVNEYGDDLTASVPIESVSGLHVRYEDETGDEQTIWGDGRSGDADARIQLPPVPCNSLEQFREFLVLHLVCQLRDCYLGMGVEPPEPFRVLGIGIDDFTEKYRHFELYEPYYDPSATIPGYRDRPQWW